jgi:hypothetical protein
MSAKPSSSRIEILEWLKSGGLLVVTVIGILLYFLFSVPATVFYSRLGTNPGEVGITYVSLLSGSTVEIAIILPFLAVALIIVAFAFSYLSIPLRAIYTEFSFPRSIRRRLRGAPTGQPQVLTDEQFEDAIRRRRFFFEKNPDFYTSIAIQNHQAPKTLAEEESLMRRQRELWQLGVRTADECAELDNINAALPVDKLMSIRFWREAFTLPAVMTMLGIRNHGRGLIITITAITVILLPTLAFIQAGEVINGKSYFGNDTGIFEYHADKVRVYPVSPKVNPGISAVLRAPNLYLLGENAQDAVLYSPSAHSTIRVPITAVIITSTR